jgi:hypothetical protein
MCYVQESVHIFKATPHPSPKWREQERSVYFLLFISFLYCPFRAHVHLLLSISQGDATGLDCAATSWRLLWIFDIQHSILVILSSFFFFIQSLIFHSLSSSFFNLSPLEELEGGLYLTASSNQRLKIAAPIVSLRNLSPFGGIRRGLSFLLAFLRRFNGFANN